ncbi:hypothetical protein Acr_00g0089870 [Actinidia rufa]|uniref:Uncharacterized protein n=1 Tax=Actinidia rufa TaxID=165716 RepID=A0A7J0DXE0_9ERIC|nr:hypothetical protein Acr_00g0089870 [Actinidia rufa]
MEVEKRKRSDDVEPDGKRARVGEDNGAVTEPEDDEVEEFYAILRRIRVAVEYFEKGNGDGGRRELTGERTVSRWSPSFQRRRISRRLTTALRAWVKWRGTRVWILTSTRIRNRTPVSVAVESCFSNVNRSSCFYCWLVVGAVAGFDSNPQACGYYQHMTLPSNCAFILSELLTSIV